MAKKKNNTKNSDVEQDYDGPYRSAAEARWYAERLHIGIHPRGDMKKFIMKVQKEMSKGLDKSLAYSKVVMALLTQVMEK